MGIGETARYGLSHDDAPRAGDCLSPARLRHRLTALRDRLTGELGPLDVPDVGDCVDAFLAFARRVRVVGGGHLHDLLHAGDVVFEGAQGVLLDEWHGFHPYTTWSTTTFANAQTLLAEAGLPPATRLGVLRTYMTRHGPGPFVTEDPALTADLPDRHNTFGRWQGAFRVGHLDTVALRYALEVAGGADALAVTHLDTAAARADLRICRSYELGGEVVDRLPAGPPGDLGRQRRLTGRLLTARPVYDDAPPDWITAIEDELNVPVALVSYGPAAADKRPVTGAVTGLLPYGRTASGTA